MSSTLERARREVLAGVAHLTCNIDLSRLSVVAASSVQESIHAAIARLEAAAQEEGRKAHAQCGKIDFCCQSCHEDQESGHAQDLPCCQQYHDAVAAARLAGRLEQAERAAAAFKHGEPERVARWVSEELDRLRREVEKP